MVIGDKSTLIIASVLILVAVISLGGTISVLAGADTPNSPTTGKVTGQQQSPSQPTPVTESNVQVTILT